MVDIPFDPDFTNSSLTLRLLHILLEFDCLVELGQHFSLVHLYVRPFPPTSIAHGNFPLMGEAIGESVGLTVRAEIPRYQRAPHFVARTYSYSYKILNGYIRPVRFSHCRQFFFLLMSHSSVYFLTTYTSANLF